LRINSSDGRHYAVYQGDGNFVVYHVGIGPIWSSRTVGTRGSLTLLRTQAVGGGAIQVPFVWDNGVRKQNLGPYSLVMQNDGNLVERISGGAPVWDTGTAGR
jgi:hypothetical protein